MIKFTPIPGCNYKFDYEKLFRDIASGALPAEQTFRTLVLNDLWFILYFVFKIGVANHPFVVQACQDVENGPDSKTLDLWAREHFKSTILTRAEVVQKILRDPEVTIGVFSHTRPLAKTFLRSVKLLFEGSEFLKQLFPDILYQSPHTQAPKWSEDDGLIVKRKGFPRKTPPKRWAFWTVFPPASTMPIGYMTMGKPPMWSTTRTPSRSSLTDSTYPRTLGPGSEPRE